MSFRNLSAGFLKYTIMKKQNIFNTIVHKQLKIITIIIIFTPILFFSTRCQKEYSYEGGPLNNGSSGGTAVYTFSGAGGPCTGSIVSGNYYSGVVLSSTNTVLLEVNVTTPGTYTVTTNTVDGITFAAAGTFTNNGIQTMILTGEGTPLATGNFVFIPPVGNGCSFNISVTNAPPAQASYTFAGAPNGCSNATVNGTYIIGFALTNTNTVTLTVNVATIGNFSVSTDTVDGISFSVAGKFTATGNQVITLSGKGKPQSPANLLFTLSGATSACSFKLSVQNPAPLGVYVLESNAGSSNLCSSYVLNGTYTTNTPLNNGNTITVKVTVTMVGNFTISTNNVNGMSFSYTGAFTNIGSQYVVLSGSGTPLLAGTFSFMPEIVGPAPIGGSACGLDITIQ
ncbi:hypothetical protein BH11BAC3_BH11BAC3_00330 [soil metagenome]